MSLADRNSARGAQPPHAGAEEILSAEATLLRAMCQFLTGSRDFLFDDAAQRLAHHRFQDAVHQAVFDTFCEIRARLPRGRESVSADLIREQLLRRLTLKGLPDVDVETLFRPKRVHRKEILSSMRLLALAGEGAAPRDGQ